MGCFGGNIRGHCSSYIDAIPASYYKVASETIQPNLMLFQRNDVECMITRINLWIHRLIHLFSLIFFIIFLLYGSETWMLHSTTKKSAGHQLAGSPDKQKRCTAIFLPCQSHSESVGYSLRATFCAHDFGLILAAILKKVFV